MTAELPMLAFTLQRAAMPMHIGSSRPARCTLFAGITIRPAATSLRTSFRLELLALGDKFHLAAWSCRRGHVQVE